MRNRVIIGVTCAVVAAMVITGVLVGVWLFLDSTTKLVERTYEFKKEDGKSVKEDVCADVKDNFVRYHLTDDDSEITVIDDFNRDLQVMKVKEDTGTKCYVLTFNSSSNAVPEAVLNASAPHGEIETENVNYKASEKAIKDKRLLGTQAQELCENLDVHWMTPTCDTEEANERGRQKRLVKPLKCDYVHFCYWQYECSGWSWPWWASWGSCGWKYRCIELYLCEK